ncbi:MAG: hypothetical protein MAG453_00267 [Calditrichaeota bacterium]|nr:hypothetical protein [Calditrichota bacterium]
MTRRGAQTDVRGFRMTRRGAQTDVRGFRMTLSAAGVTHGFSLTQTLVPVLACQAPL